MIKNQLGKLMERFNEISKMKDSKNQASNTKWTLREKFPNKNH